MKAAMLLSTLLLAVTACKGTDYLDSRSLSGNGGGNSGLNSSAAPTPRPVGPPPDASCKSDSNQQLASGNLSKRQSGRDFVANSTITLAAAGAFVDFTSQFNFVSSSAPSKYRDQFRDKLKEYSGVRSANFYSEKPFKAFYQELSSPITCTLIPITSMAKKMQTGSPTEVSFSPALPYFISPTEASDLYGKELAATAKFNSKATVKIAGNSGSAVGTVIDGTVTIEPVDGSKFGAQHAYRVTANFGDFKKTLALGLLPVVTYYIKDGKFVAVIVNTGEDPPTVTYQ